MRAVAPQLAGWAGWLALSLSLSVAAGVSACGGSMLKDNIYGDPARHAALTAAAQVDAGELEGQATWYGERHQGRRTASGEPFDMNAFTCAHRTLPFGAVVRVTREDTRQSVVVRVNDRGPYGHGRVVDLSRAAAEEIDLVDAGHEPVFIEVLALPE